MSPEQKACRLREVTDEINRLRRMVDAAEMATNALGDDDRQALSVLLSAISDGLAQQVVMIEATA